MSALVQLATSSASISSPEGGVAALQGLASRSSRASSASSSGRAGRGSRRCCGSSPASTGRRRARCASPASTSARSAAGRLARVPLALDRLRRPALLARARGRADRSRARRDRSSALRGAPRGARDRTRRRAARTRRPRAPAATRIRASSPAGSSSGSRSARRSRPAALFLIADEPTGELDAATARRRARADRASSCASRAATALVVSHDPASAERADRVVHVRDGRIADERCRRRRPATARSSSAAAAGSGFPRTCSAPGRNRPPCDGRAPRRRGRPRATGAVCLDTAPRPHATKPFRAAGGQCF